MYIYVYSIYNVYVICVYIYIHIMKCLYIYIYITYIYIYIYIHTFFLRTAHNIAMHSTRTGVLYETGVKPYLIHRHFSSEQRLHQLEPEQSHRGRAKGEKTRGRGGRKGEKEKRGKKPRDHPCQFDC